MDPMQPAMPTPPAVQPVAIKPPETKPAETRSIPLKPSEGKAPEILIKPTTVPRLEKAPSYTVLACATLQELEQKVSKLLDGGSYRLHGPPFIFHDQICQAMAMNQFLRP